MSTGSITRVRLKSLFIGEIDGESEAIKRHDFKDLFYNYGDRYKELLDGDKFLIQGRKGTGKTYLAKYIEWKIKNEKKQWCKLCDSSQVNFQAICELNGRDFFRGEQELFWKWVIFVQFAFELMERYPKKSRIPFTKLNKIRKFLKKKYPTRGELFSKVSYSQYIEGVLSAKKNIFSANTKASETSTYQKVDYLTQCDFLEKTLMPILAKKCSITLIYDDLDNLESGVHLDPLYVDLLSALLKCAHKMNLEFAKLNQEKSSKLIVVLRNDIISYMQDHNSNLNKYTSDCVDLCWTEKTYNQKQWEHPLMNLILSKIKRTTQQYSSLNNEELFKLLFPMEISGKETIYHLLDNSFGRPRDIIKFLNIVQNNNPNIYKFTVKSFNQAGKQYSNWFYDELRNEIAIHSNADLLREGLNLIKNIKKRHFLYSDAKSEFVNNKSNYPNITNLDEALSQMYKFGVIGNSWDVERNGQRKRNYSWAYRQNSSTQPNFGETFIVHSALRNKFSI